MLGQRLPFAGAWGLEFTIRRLGRVSVSILDASWLPLAYCKPATDGAFAEGRTFAGIDFPGRCLLKCIVMSLVYLVGMVVIWIAPETNGKPLPE